NFFEHPYFNMDKLCLRSYIKTRFLLGLTATQIHDELTTAYGQCVVAYRTVAHWIHRFSSGRESLDDDPRSGRRLSVITQQNIEAVKDLVNDDPHISIDILLTLPHKLTSAQRQRRVDICIENLQKIESGTWKLCDIVTGDEFMRYSF
ncbi:unnamed protein product, partial [Rotaria sp. Silwood1]